jgi:hypothetical protein
MPGNNKELLIKSKVEDASFKKLASSIKDLQKTMEGFNKGIAGLTKTFKDLDKELVNKVKDFDKFKSAISSADKVLKSHTTTIKDYIKALSGITGASPSGATGSSGPAAGTQIIPMPGGGYVVAPPPGTGGGGARAGGGGAGGGGIGRGAGGGGGGGGASLNRFARQAQYVTGIGADIAGTVQNMKTAQFTNMAQVQSVGGNVYKNLLSGDISDLVALQRVRQLGMGLNDMVGGQGAMKIQSALQGIGGVLGGVQGGAGGVTGAGVSNILDVFKGNATGKFSAEEANNLGTTINAIKGMAPEHFANLGMFMQMAPALMQGNRRLGGQAMHAAGIGAGAGFLPQESIGMFTQMANQFGAQSMFGSPTTTRSVSPVPGMSAQEARSIEAMGYARSSVPGSIEDYRRSLGRDPRTGGIVTTSTTGGRGLANIMSEGAQHGFDPSLIGQLVGGAGMAMPGVSNVSSRIGQGEKILANAIQEGVSKGITDVQTLEALAKAVGGAAIAAASGQGSGNLARFLTAGLTNETATPQMIQQRMAGLEGIGASIQGNPYLSTAARASASKILGPGASALEVNQLGGASPLKLLNSGMLDALFPEGGARTQELESQVNTMLNTVLSTGSSTAAGPTKRLKEMLGGKGMAGFKGNSKAAQLMSALSIGTFGFGEDQFQPLSQFFENFGDLESLSPGERYSGDAFNRVKKQGDLAAAAQGGTATAQIKAMSDLLSDKNNVTSMGIMFGQMGEAMKLASSLPSNADKWKNATDFVDKLEELVDKINKDTVKKTNELSPRPKAGK